MDPEIRAQFEETRLHFDVAAEGMRGELQLVSAHLSSRLESVSSRTDRLEPAVEETRRHFDVVAEGMRSDVRLVAEGVSSLGERVDRLEQNLREEIRETRRDLTALLTASYTDLDRRVWRLEGDR